MADYTVNYDGLTVEEAQALANSGIELDQVFACDITGIMQEYQDACNWISNEVVFGENQGDFVLEDWNFKVVGCEEDNVLHLRVRGTVNKM